MRRSRPRRQVPSLSGLWRASVAVQAIAQSIPPEPIEPIERPREKQKQQQQQPDRNMINGGTGRPGGVAASTPQPSQFLAPGTRSCERHHQQQQESDRNLVGEAATLRSLSTPPAEPAADISNGNDQRSFREPAHVSPFSGGRNVVGGAPASRSLPCPPAEPVTDARSCNDHRSVREPAQDTPLSGDRSVVGGAAASSSLLPSLSAKPKHGARDGCPDENDQRRDLLVVARAADEHQNDHNHHRHDRVVGFDRCAGRGSVPAFDFAGTAKKSDGYTRENGRREQPVVVAPTEQQTVGRCVGRGSTDPTGEEEPASSAAKRKHHHQDDRGLSSSCEAGARAGAETVDVDEAGPGDGSDCDHDCKYDYNCNRDCDENNACVVSFWKPVELDSGKEEGDSARGGGNGGGMGDGAAEAAAAAAAAAADAGDGVCVGSAPCDGSCYTVDDASAGVSFGKPIASDCVVGGGGEKGGDEDRKDCRDIRDSYGFDCSKSTEDNYRVGHRNFAERFREARSLLDYGYHSNYALERQEVQDDIIQEALRVEALGSLESPWAVFTAGAMGAGKSHVMRTLGERGIFPMEAFVQVDPDRLRRELPEMQAYVRRDSGTAGSLTHKEAGLMAEILEETALLEGRNILVDGSMRDGGWYAVHVAALRRRFPKLRVAIIHVWAPEEEVQTRAARRATQTGRVIPPSILHDTIRAVPKSVEYLAPLADYCVRIDNVGDHHSSLPPQLSSSASTGDDEGHAPLSCHLPSFPPGSFSPSPPPSSPAFSSSAEQPPFPPFVDSPVGSPADAPAGGCGNDCGGGCGGLGCSGSAAAENEEGSRGRSRDRSRDRLAGNAADSPADNPGGGGSGDCKTRDGPAEERKGEDDPRDWFRNSYWDRSADNGAAAVGPAVGPTDSPVAIHGAVAATTADGACRDGIVEGEGGCFSTMDGDVTGCCSSFDAEPEGGVVVTDDGDGNPARGDLFYSFGLSSDLALSGSGGGNGGGLEAVGSKAGTATIGHGGARPLHEAGGVYAGAAKGGDGGSLRVPHRCSTAKGVSRKSCSTGSKIKCSSSSSSSSAARGGGGGGGGGGSPSRSGRSSHETGSVSELEGAIDGCGGDCIGDRACDHIGGNSDGGNNRAASTMFSERQARCFRERPAGFDAIVEADSGVGSVCGSCGSCGRGECGAAGREEGLPVLATPGETWETFRRMFHQETFRGPVGE